MLELTQYGASGTGVGTARSAASGSVDAVRFWYGCISPAPLKSQG